MQDRSGSSIFLLCAPNGSAGVARRVFYCVLPNGSIGVGRRLIYFVPLMVDRIRS